MHHSKEQRRKIRDIKTQLRINKNKSATYEINDDDICSCGTIYMLSEDGFQQCSNKQCGIICTNVLDYSPEWRQYNEDRNSADHSRCGNPIDPLLRESSYACKISCGSHSSIEMKKLQQYVDWMRMPPHEKALYDEFAIITNLAQNGKIPKVVIDYAKVIYADFYNQQTFRGTNREGLRAGAISMACWINDCPRSNNEIATLFKIDNASASQGCSLAEDMLKKRERTFYVADKSKMCNIQPSVFIERFCSKFEFSDENTMLATFIAEIVDKFEYIPDNRPQAIAVGIIYFVSKYCHLGYTKSYIAKRLDNEVSEVTINKCFIKLEKLREHILPSTIYQEYLQILKEQSIKPKTKRIKLN